MEETKDENNEVKQKTESTQNESPVQEESPARRSLLWIFAGGYLVYTAIACVKGSSKEQMMQVRISGSRRHFYCDRCCASYQSCPQSG